MKKILIFSVAVIAIALAAVYLLIPTHLSLRSIAYINCPDNAAGRFLSNENDWISWWPGEKQQGAEQVYSYEGIDFRPISKAYNGTKLATSFDGATIEGNLVHAKSAYDSIVVVWQYAVKTSANPFIRVAQYRQLKKLKQHTDAVLARLKSFLENKDNIYGITIKEIRVTDTLLISSSFESTAYPPMETVYQSIDKLKKYVADNKAQETGFVMLNVSRLDKGKYKTRIAIPINTTIPESGNTQIRKMVPGRILVSEIKGGPAKIEAAFIQFRNYLTDYDLASPAIPFESLVTSRLPVKDSAGWITRIYYPIL